MSPRVVVVGLGPAGADLVLPAARDALAAAPLRIARTGRHPAVEELAGHGLSFETLDEVYDSAADLGEVYTEIAHRIVTAAREHGTVAYAVPGNPGVAERSVALLRDAAAAGTVELDIVPGLSFAELAWARLGVDPMDGATVTDAREFVPSGGRMLIAQCDSALVLSDVKLALLEVLPPRAPVTVLSRLGLPDETVSAVALADLDRVVEPDHLTSVYVEAPGNAPGQEAARELSRLLALAERLRRPDGCPWDAEQTHHSLTRYLLEEAYEVVEAVEKLPPGAPEAGIESTSYAALEDELGDLLYQVIFHAVLAEEADAFTMADVARGIHDKLVRRHPHVFGDTDADTTSDVMRNWEQIKKDEKGASSIVSGITPGLPSLLYTHKLFRKSASIGLDPGSAPDALVRLAGALDALRAADRPDQLEAALGELLAGAVVLARSGGIDAESVLRGWAARFRERFEAMEATAAQRGIDLAAADPDEVEELWWGLSPG